MVYQKKDITQPQKRKYSTCYNMNELQKHCAKQKHQSISMKCPEQEDPQGQKRDQWLHPAEDLGEMGGTC